MYKLGSGYKPFGNSGLVRMVGSTQTWMSRKQVNVHRFLIGALNRDAVGKKYGHASRLNHSNLYKGVVNLGL
jgi:hypothetical protein